MRGDATAVYVEEWCGAVVIDVVVVVVRVIIIIVGG